MYVKLGAIHFVCIVIIPVLLFPSHHQSKCPNSSIPRTLSISTSAFSPATMALQAPRTASAAPATRPYPVQPPAVKSRAQATRPPGWGSHNATPPASAPLAPASTRQGASSPSTRLLRYGALSRVSLNDVGRIICGQRIFGARASSPSAGHPAPTQVVQLFGDVLYILAQPTIQVFGSSATTLML